MLQSELAKRKLLFCFFKFPQISLKKVPNRFCSSAAVSLASTLLDLFGLFWSSWQVLSDLVVSGLLMHIILYWSLTLDFVWTTEGQTFCTQQQRLWCSSLLCRNVNLYFDLTQPCPSLLPEAAQSMMLPTPWHHVVLWELCAEGAIWCSLLKVASFKLLSTIKT